MFCCDRCGNELEGRYELIGSLFLERESLDYGCSGCKEKEGMVLRDTMDLWNEINKVGTAHTF